MGEVAIVLAGGLGTRIRALHPEVPKPMIRVGGKPFLEWQLRWLKREGIEETVLSAGYRAEVLRGYFTEPRVEGMKVRCVVEEAPRGTAGAARYAVQEVAAAWCVVCNGDSLCPAGLGPIRAAGARDDADVVLLVSEVSDARDYGTVQVDEQGCVTGFVEKGVAAGPGLVNAGVYYMRTAWLRGLPERIPLSFEREVFPGMGRGRLRAVCTATPFMDIGVPERLAQAETFVSTWLADEVTRGGV